MRFWAHFARFVICLLVISPPATAQDTSWLQVEAQPDLATAQERARAYAALFPNVEGYRTGAWYAIVLGPMTREVAGQKLLALRDENLIPRDSFIADGSAFDQRFWPTGVAQTDPSVEPAPEIAPEVVVEPEVVVVPEETLAEARDAEAALSKDEKMALQSALAWFGFYDGSIDGAFGKGTRASFAAWQEAKGFDPTGVLTTKQRQSLLAAEDNEKTTFGFDLVTEAESGIEVTLPMSLIAFEGYEPPFVQFAPRDAAGPRLLLISEPGDRASLAGLYDLLQSMEIMPATGERALGETEFTIEAASAQIASYAWARASKGQVKGFIVTWTPQNADKIARIAEVAKASFRSVGDKALDPGLVPLDEAARQGLLTGLVPRRPAFSRSGVYVSAEGAVATKADGLEACQRITLDGGIPARLTAVDAAFGLAILTPDMALSPPAVAEMTNASPRRGTEIVVAGYAYGDKLPAPVLTFGRLDEVGGLEGETGLLRLSAPVLEGDQGGPVLSTDGAFLGLLTGPAADPAKALPAGVVFAADAAALASLLSANGIAPVTSAGGTLTPDALSKAALGMTLRVDCWN